MPDKGISLMFSIDKKKNENALTLIDELGVDFQIKDYGTPLLLACVYDNTEVGKYCIEKGANIHVRDNAGDTPLILSCKNGNFELVKLLVEQGADVNTKDEYDVTALMAAISRHPENLDIIEYLLRNKADAFIKMEKNANHPGKIANNAYELAEYFGKKEILDLIRKYNNKK